MIDTITFNFGFVPTGQPILGRSDGPDRNELMSRIVDATIALDIQVSECLSRLMPGAHTKNQLILAKINTRRRLWLIQALDSPATHETSAATDGGKSKGEGREAELSDLLSCVWTALSLSRQLTSTPWMITGIDWANGSPSGTDGHRPMNIEGEKIDDGFLWDVLQFTERVQIDLRLFFGIEPCPQCDFDLG